MHVMSTTVAPFDRHETFDGTSDFYCVGLNQALLNGLKQGDVVGVKMDASKTNQTRGVSNYELIHITDVIFVVAGEAKERRLTDKPSAIVNFESMEIASTQP